MILVFILCLYAVIFTIISYMQIRFLKKESQKKAFILSEQEYQKAANIAVQNEKFKI